MILGLGENFVAEIDESIFRKKKTIIEVFREIGYLAELREEYKCFVCVVVNRNEDAANGKQKNKAWEKMVIKFNSQNGTSVHRDVKIL